MKSGQWYKVLVENKITMEVGDDGKRRLKPCRSEPNNPEVNWSSVWELASQPGLDSLETSFLWRMLHNLLPSPARLFHMQIRNSTTPNCQLCNQNIRGDLHHCLITCSYNYEVSSWLMSKIRGFVPGLPTRRVVLLDLGQLDDRHRFPMVWLVANTLALVWDSRICGKKPDLHKIRAFLEAKINILRKTRFRNQTDTMQSLSSLI